MSQTVQQVLHWAASQLVESDSAKLDARLLLAHSLQKTNTWLHTWPDYSLQPSEIAQFESLVKQRQLGHPVAYLIGYRDFWSLRLQVSPDTLIPRPETELMVEQILSLESATSARVLDMGTGTGAIALSLAKERPHWQVEGIDCQPGAVELAQKNAALNDLAQVDIYQSDWFSAVSGKFDIIVSNPPYVEQDSPWLTQGDVRFEPLSALISGSDGMDDIEIISSQAKAYLRQNGLLMFEHGYQQAEQVRQCLSANGFHQIQTFEDLNLQPRVTCARV